MSGAEALDGPEGVGGCLAYRCCECCELGIVHGDADQGDRSVGSAGGEGCCWPSEPVQSLGGVGTESGYDDVDLGDAWRKAAVDGQAERDADGHPGGVAGHPEG